MPYDLRHAMRSPTPPWRCMYGGHPTRVARRPGPLRPEGVLARLHGILGGAGSRADLRARLLGALRGRHTEVEIRWTLLVSRPGKAGSRWPRRDLTWHQTSRSVLDRNRRRNE